MHTGYHAPIGAAAHITINPPRSIISFSPVVLPAPGRRVKAAVLELKGHLDRTWVAVSGHSAWGWTASVLLGTSNTDPVTDSRGMNSRRALKRAWILAGIGNGSADITDLGKNLVPFYGPNFGTMVTPALVMYGNKDLSPYLTTLGADRHADPYALALGPNDLLTLEGAKHGLGGISGWDAGETLDESPERLAVVQRLTWAYLSSMLFDGGSASVGWM